MIAYRAFDCRPENGRYGGLSPMRSTPRSVVAIFSVIGLVVACGSQGADPTLGPGDQQGNDAGLDSSPGSFDPGASDGGRDGSSGCKPRPCADAKAGCG